MACAAVPVADPIGDPERMIPVRGGGEPGAAPLTRNRSPYTIRAVGADDRGGRSPITGESTMDEPTYRPPALAEVGGFNADTLGSDVGFKDDGFLFYGG